MTQSTANSQVELFDLSGRLLRNWKIIGDSQPLYVGDLDAGIYEIRIQQENRLSQNKIVVVK
jgi:hypothetical protein